MTESPVVHDKTIDYKGLTKQIIKENILLRKRGPLRCKKITEKECDYYYMKTTLDTLLQDTTAIRVFKDSLENRGLNIVEAKKKK